MTEWGTLWSHVLSLCACGHYATSHSHGGGSCDSCDCTQARESWPCCYPQPDWRAMYLAAVELEPETARRIRDGETKDDWSDLVDREGGES